MPRPTLTRLQRALLLASLATVGLPAPAVPILTWTGQGMSADFSSRDLIAGRTNWGTDLPVERGHYTLVFDGTRRTAPVNDLSFLQLAGLSFASGAGAFQLSGKGFNNSGDIVNRSAQLQTIHNPVNVNGAQRWFGGSAGLQVLGDFTQHGSGSHLVLDEGSVLRPSSVGFNGGAMTVRPGAVLDLAAFDSVTLGGEAQGSYTLNIAGVGAGKGVRMPGNLHVAKGGFNVTGGANLALVHNLMMGTAEASRADETVLATVSGTGTRLHVPGTLFLGGEAAGVLQVADGARLEAGGRLSASPQPLAPTQATVSGGATWVGSRLEMARQAGANETLVTLRDGGRLTLYDDLEIGMQARTDDPQAISARVRVQAGGHLDSPQADAHIGAGGVGRLEVGGGGQARLRDLRMGISPDKRGRGELSLAGAGSLLELRSGDAARARLELLDGARLAVSENLLLRDGAQMQLEAATLQVGTARDLNRGAALALHSGAVLRVGQSSIEATDLVGRGDDTVLQLTGHSRLTVSREMSWGGGNLALSATDELDTRGAIARIGGDAAARVTLTRSDTHTSRWLAGTAEVGGVREARLHIDQALMQAEVLTIGGGTGRAGLVRVSGRGDAQPQLTAGRLALGDHGGSGHLVIEDGARVHATSLVLGGSGSGLVQAAPWARVQATHLDIGAGGRAELHRIEIEEARIQRGGLLQLPAAYAAGGHIRSLELAGGTLERSSGTATLTQLGGFGLVRGDLGTLQGLSVFGGDLALHGQAAGDGLQVQQFMGLGIGDDLELGFDTAVRTPVLSLGGSSRLSSRSVLEVGLLAVGNFLGDTVLDAPLRLEGGVSISGRLALHGDVSGPGQFVNTSGLRRGSLSLLAAYRPEAERSRFTMNSVTLGDSALLELDLASPDSFESLAFDGLLKAGGTLRLRFGDVPGWNAGATLDLLDWDSLEGGFAQVEVLGLDTARVDLSRLAIDGTVGVSPVPEPAGWAMLGLGIGFIAWRRRAVLAQP